MNVNIVARADADLESVRLEAIQRAAQLGGHISGDPDITTTGTAATDQGTIILDGSGYAVYTWPLIRAFTSLDNVAPTLLPPHVI